LSIFPLPAESELLPLFLGLQKPRASDAMSRLEAVGSRYHFTPFFTGLLDLQLLADEFLQPDSLLARIMGQAGASALTRLSEDCKREFRAIISHTPRLVAGTTELTPNAIGLQYIVEIPPELAKQLSSLVAEMPMAEDDSSRLLEFSFGLKPGPVRDFLREQVIAIAAAPYRCEQLQQLNVSAANTLARLDQPTPPLVNNFRGLRVSLSRFSMLDSVPDEIAGLLAVHVEQPEMFVGMAQMFLPDLAGLNLVKGDPPVQIPSSLIPMTNVTAFAALSDTAIGVAFGAGEEQGLGAFLERKVAGDGTFMSLNYDTAAYLDFTRHTGRKWRAGPSGADNEENRYRAGEDQPAAVMEIAEAIQQAYKAVAGRSGMRLRFTDQGLVIDSRMTFQ